MPRVSRLIVTLAAAGLALVAVPAGPAAAGAAPCGTLTYDASAPPVYSHVVVIMEENLSYGAFNKTSQAPYLHGLSRACGSEAFMHAATQPSQPNYMAATSGVATALGTRTSNNNIFHQVQSAGKSWKSYQESMPSNCAGSSGFYKTGHNPAYWYDDLRTPVNTCTANDVPLKPGLDNAIANDALPTYSWITPNNCNDMHWLTGCPDASTQRVAAGDQWMASLLPRLTAMPSYQAGRTLILITWDEGSGPSTTGIDCTEPTVYAGHPACQIPTIVVSPYISPGAVDRSDQNLYSLLGTTEDILGYPRLGRAATNTQSLRPGLRF